MARKQAGPTLFDAVEVEEDREAETCPHRHEDPTETNWGPPYGWRMTYTCRACNHVRGRVR